MKKKETYYLIDYENVHADGLKGCEKLGSKDHIYIFFTQNAKNLDMTEISNHGDAELDMFEVAAGNQSLDMHIVSYMGYLAGQYNGGCKVVVVSKDTDYDKIIKFWNEQSNVAFSRSHHIDISETQKKDTSSKQSISTSNQKPNVSGEEKTKLNNEIMKVMSDEGYEPRDVNDIAQIVSGAYGDKYMLRIVHNRLEEKYIDYLDIYNTVKPVISKYMKDGFLKQTNSAKESEKTLKNNEIQTLLSELGYSREIISKVASIVVNNMVNGKQQIYRTIISEYGQTEGLEIYRSIKKNIG